MIPCRMDGRLAAALWAACFVLVVGRAVGRADMQVVFRQAFDAGGVPADYVTATGEANKFDQIATTGANFTWSVTGNALQGVRTAATHFGGVNRVTDLPVPCAAVYSFSVSFLSVSTTASPAIWFFVGSSFGTGVDTVPPTTDVFARFGLSPQTIGTTDFKVRRDPPAQLVGPAFSGKQTVVWALNTHDQSLFYTTPSGTTAEMTPNTWDLWIGTTQVMSHEPALTGTQGLGRLKFYARSATMAFQVDDFSVTAISPPSPRSMILIR